MRLREYEQIAERDALHGGRRVAVGHQTCVTRAYHLDAIKLSKFETWQMRPGSCLWIMPCSIYNDMERQRARFISIIIISFRSESESECLDPQMSLALNFTRVLGK